MVRQMAVRRLMERRIRISTSKQQLQQKIRRANGRQVGLSRPCLPSGRFQRQLAQRGQALGVGWLPATITITAT